jgi:hypothetical protein
MSDRVELIRALNSTLELMFDGFCQVCLRLAIYRKMRKNSLSAQFSVERYIDLIINKSFSSSSHLHHQIIFIIKSFSSSSRFHHQIVFIIKSCSSSSRFHQIVLIKSFSSSRSHHQAVLIIKSYYQAIVASQSIKSIYQVILASHLIKSSYQVVASTQKRS